MEVFRGDIIRAEASYNEKCVEKKARPYLVISNNLNNKYGSVIVGVPFTTASRDLPTHYRFWWNGKMQTVLCEQPTLISKERIKRVLDVIEDEDLKEVESRVKLQLGLK